jgi:phage terminase small subunit
MSNVPITRKLTTKQTALVDTIVANGCTIAKAAELAGYSAGESGRVTATKTMKLPHVQQYLMQRMNEEFGLSATLAAGTVRRLAMGAKSEYVQLEASKDLLDRAGYKPIDRSQVQVAGDIKVQIDLG